MVNKTVTPRPSTQAISFGQVADAYDRARPTYPDAAVDWMLPAGTAQVLDLGAGTGKLTRSLVARGLETVAVDPSPEMLARLTRTLPGIESRIGTAEAIPLPDASVDVVVIGQAWHWVEPSRAVPEIARVLRPGGTLAPVWNVRDGTIDWVAWLSRLLEAGEAPTYTGVPRIGAPFGPTQSCDVAWSVDYDEDGLVDLVMSRSTTIAMDDHAREALVARVRGLFAEVAGGRRSVAVPYVTHAFRCRKAA